MLKLLVMSTLYPNLAQPRHGIFVETRLRQLMASHPVEAVVVAPVPWFPFSDKRFPRYVDSRNIPMVEERHGVTIYHPRYLVIPKIGMLLTPLFLALAFLWQMLAIKRTGYNFDLVDGHYYYPDGVGIALISRLFKVPFTVTARGTDINLIPAYRLPRKMILWAASKAAASITVCAALKDEMAKIGAVKEKINVLRNGVNLELFHPQDRDKCRDKWGIKGKTLLSVGHLIERKGHHLVVAAMRDLPDCNLLIAGDGEEQDALNVLVKQHGLEQRVRFLGALDQNQLSEVYSAVDVMVLASSREGWANVLLESMACGTPVVATNIWGTPEVVATAEAGLLVPERTSGSIAKTVANLFQEYPDREATRRYAELFSWEETCNKLYALLNGLSEANLRKDGSATVEKI